MVQRMTRKQIQGPPLSDVAFAEWFVDEIMPDMHPIPWKALTRVENLRKVKSARQYLVHFGFTVTSHQGQVMSLMWMLGPNFFEFEPFDEILASTSMSPDQKVDALWAVDDASMEVAEQGCDDRYWYPRMVPGNILGKRAWSEMSKAELDAPIDEADSDPWSHFIDNHPR